jgi:hypothetical protein
MAHERIVAAARAALGQDGFAAAWAEGRDVPLEQAIAEALEVRAGRAAPPGCVSPGAA